MKKILIRHAEFISASKKILKQVQDDMKYVIPLVSFLAVFFLVAGVSRVLANGEEVKRGEEIWQKLSADQVKCENLTDDEFENLGEFFMERMVGFTANHEAMDQQMEQMMGKENLKEMHIAMGKRISGCDINASVNGDGNNMMAYGMMGMMMNMMNSSNFTRGGGEWDMMGPGMMGWGQGYGAMGQFGANTFWIWSILSWLTWILVIVALVAFIRWMWKKGDKQR